MSQPTLMVLATLEWHTGIPYGGKEVSVVIPEFDIYDEEEKKVAGREALLTYGVPPDEVTLNLEETSEYRLVFTARIGEYHHYANPHTSTQNVNIKYRYVWVHRGIAYEMQECDTSIPIAKLQEGK